MTSEGRVINARQRGRREVDVALGKIGPYDRREAPERFAHELGVRGLSWMIQTVLDDHYPTDVFPQDRVQYGVNWAGEHGGEDIDPGVKWIALLRLALEEVPDA